jgi:hypothetical protein
MIRDLDLDLWRMVIGLDSVVVGSVEVILSNTTKQVENRDLFPKSWLRLCKLDHTGINARFKLPVPEFVTCKIHNQARKCFISL